MISTKFIFLSLEEDANGDVRPSAIKATSNAPTMAAVVSILRVGIV